LPDSDPPEETTVSGPFDLSEYGEPAEVMTDDGAGADATDPDLVEVLTGHAGDTGLVAGDGPDHTISFAGTADTDGTHDPFDEDGSDGGEFDDGTVVVEEVPWDDPLDDLSAQLDLGSPGYDTGYASDGSDDDLSDLEF
jgi:hypothetical protein